MPWIKKRSKKASRTRLVSLAAILGFLLILSSAFALSKQNAASSDTFPSALSTRESASLRPYPARNLDAKSLIRQKQGFILIKPSKVAVIDEGFPEKSLSAEEAIHLDGGAGDRFRRSALLQFDLSQINQAPVEAAYLRLYNGETLENNATRTIRIRSLTKPWTTGANWLTYDGKHLWTAEGGMEDESEYEAAQTVFRIVKWEPSWFMDVTPLVKEWTGGAANFGVSIRADDRISLMPPSKENTGPTLIVLTKPADKIASALQSLKFDFVDAPFADPNIGIVNALVQADRLGLDPAYLEALEKYYASVIDEQGRFRPTARFQFKNYYVAGFGPSLLYLYEKTGKEKYAAAVRTLRQLLTPEKMKNGLFIEEKHQSVQTELAMFAIPFLAEYGISFRDRQSLNLAVDQMLKLLETTTWKEADFLPNTYVYEKGGIGKGWARGVGYLFAGLGKLLSYEEVKEHPRYSDLENSYKQLASTLFKYRTGGMWRGLLQLQTSPADTSGSSLLAIGYEYGVRNGILKPESYRIVDEALDAITNYSKTGLDLGQSFPPNQDLTYRTTNFGATRHALGYWLELITLVAGR
ncbi:DNRLRE domain-containing protein [Cohnella sp. CFH 77786]|uniref:glycoside hydrolase family 88 protein n=1 Tax=Cohnella sp. CFH 77786 TaxID=2662265 RepID=UPI001C60D3F5|nr:glycoside hydrolase family 88 protein [Cohnella sp. CFH 77786]MBW5447121.1 DNRLRE domain-containing protein [Cohnella sp. CFH 77786]